MLAQIRDRDDNRAWISALVSGLEVGHGLPLLLLVHRTSYTVIQSRAVLGAFQLLALSLIKSMIQLIIVSPLIVVIHTGTVYDVEVGLSLIQN